MGAVLAYIFYLLSSTGSKLQRRHIAIRRETDEGQVDFAFRVMLITFIFSPVLLFFNPLRLEQPIGQVILLALLCDLSGAVSISTQYIAQRHTEAGLTSLLGNMYIPFSIVLSSLFLNERLSGRQLIGAVLLIVAAVMVSRKHRVSRWKFDRYFWMNVISGLILAVTLNAERALIKHNGIASGTMISWGAQATCLGLGALIFAGRSQYDFKDTALTGGLRFVQQLSWVIYATILANLSVATATASFSTIVVFISAALFLNEREDLKRKIMGSFIATAGLLLMV